RFCPRTSATHQPSRSADTTVAASLGTAMAPSCPVGRPDGNARPWGQSGHAASYLHDNVCQAASYGTVIGGKKATRESGPVPAAGGRPGPVLHRPEPGTAVQGPAR